MVFNAIRERTKKLLEVMDEEESPLQVSLLRQSLPILGSIEENLNKFEEIWADDLIKRANNNSPNTSSANDKNLDK